MKKEKTYEVTIRNTKDARAMPFALRVNIFSIAAFILFICAIFGLGAMAAIKYYDSLKDAQVLGANINQINNVLAAKETRISVLNTDIADLETDLDVLEIDLDVVETQVVVYKDKVTGLENENVDLSVKMSTSYQSSLQQQISSLETTIGGLSEIEFASGSINNGVMLLDWFDGGSEVFAKRVPVQVIDVQTGLSFNVERFGGWYHADSQPLSQEDTAVMKSIVGQWTWARRAIWVKIEGKYYAASMNAMPHLASPNRGNGFDGHFCIHFFKSRVHETSEPCEKHQACVIEAFLNADKLVQ